MRVRELQNLARRHVMGAEALYARFKLQVTEIESLVADTTQLKLQNLSMLDVGCGQQLKLAQYFAIRGNEVTGIDINVIPHGLSIYPYVELYRANGWTRLVKTVGRKALGVDMRFSRRLRQDFGGGSTRRLRLYQMNAEEMSFPDESFDFAYSRSTFEHLPNPGRVIEEMKRVLRPSGVIYIGFHLYTCDTGSHDPRVLAGDRDEIPMWAHLRPQHAHLVSSNSYLNRMKLADWRELFAEHLPGGRVTLHQRNREEEEPLLRDLRTQGELAEFDDDELLTDVVSIVWQKDGAAS